MLRVLVADLSTPQLVRGGVLGLLYSAGAELGHALSLKTQDQTFATFWPPAGILLAALLLTQHRFWPALLAAACVANLASDVLHDKSVPVSLGYCLANCGEACIGAEMLRRLVGMPFTLERIWAVSALALTALASAVFGATVGAAVVNVAFNVPYWSALQVWWVADAAGVLVVAPVVLAWMTGDDVSFKVVRSWRVIEAVTLFAGLVLATEGVYGNLLPPPLNVPIFILPFLLWAGLRFDARGAAVAILVVALIGTWNLSQWRGPYVPLSAEPGQQVLRAQASLCVASVCVLALAAIVAERKQAEQQRIKLIGELEQALNEIKTLRGFIPLCAWCKKVRDDQGSWQRLEDYVSTHTQAEITHGMCPECMEKQLERMRAS